MPNDSNNDPLQQVRIEAPQKSAAPVEPSQDDLSERALADGKSKGKSKGKAATDPVVPEVPPTVDVKVKRYKVLRKITISWGGQMITLHADQEVSDESYGPGACERMINSGVALEEVL